MKLLFRRKHDGKILKPIQTLDAYVRLQNAAGNRVWRASKHTLPQFFDVLTHDIDRGDVLRDIRDGQLWIVEYTSQHGLRMQTRKGGVAGNVQRGMTYFGLVNYVRVGRNYTPKRPGVVAKEITRTEHPYTKYDESKVRQRIDNARALAAAMIQAGNDAKRFGIGVILVYPDGSMKSTDPRGVIQK
nr:MAG TPA: hypothetical protein [Caudoviricetes sp.]